jgi:hypothetical protein
VVPPKLDGTTSWSLFRRKFWGRGRWQRLGIL